jgi:hypothetical protein
MDPGCKKIRIRNKHPSAILLKKEDDLALAKEVRIWNSFPVEHLPGTR